MSKRLIDRRQFAKSVAGAAAVVAGGATMARTAKGCPLVFDAAGNRVEYWCIVDIDDTNPMLWLYTYENCNTGETRDAWGPPGGSEGDCGDAENDPGCATKSEIGRWDEIELDGQHFLLRPDTTPEQKLLANQLPAKRLQ